ncbi:MAG: hypothetical protein WC865_07855 [Bacteroidales bacterium]
MLERNFVQTVASGIRDNWFQNAYSDYQGDTYLYKDVAKKIIKFHMIFEKHKNGSIAIPILSDFHREDIQNILNHSESDVLFVSEEYYPGTDVSKLPALRAVFKLNDLSLLYSREPGLEENVAGSA